MKKNRIIVTKWMILVRKLILRISIAIIPNRIYIIIREEIRRLGERMDPSESILPNSLPAFT